MLSENESFYIQLCMVTGIPAIHSIWRSTVYNTGCLSSLCKYSNFANIVIKHKSRFLLQIYFTYYYNYYVLWAIHSIYELGWCRKQTNRRFVNRNIAYKSIYIKRLYKVFFLIINCNATISLVIVYYKSSACVNVNFLYFHLSHDCMFGVLIGWNVVWRDTANMILNREVFFENLFDNFVLLEQNVPLLRFF